MYIDVHCHIDRLEDLDVVVKRANKKRVNLIVSNGVNPENNKKVFELSEKFEEIKFSAGMYPLDSLDLSDNEIDKEIEKIRELKDKIVSIGEIGLDLKHDEREKGFERQKKTFSKFVNLGIELNKPVIVHSRKAELDAIELLEELKAKKVIMHCFSGKFKLVDRIVNNGWSLSIPTSANHLEHFQKIIERVPLENLFCETDSPYLHPDKDFPNEPGNVVVSYKKIAEIKGLSLKNVEKELEKNFKRMFDE